MGARTGQQYLEALKANQAEVYYNGERVTDIVTHPVFAGPIKAIMAQYDLQHDPQFSNVCLFPSPTTGDLVSTSFLLARSQQELTKRKRHFKIRADHHFGVMGRAPDFMNALVSGWYFTADHYGKSNAAFGENARRYFEHVRENDLYLTHVLVNPQIDRSRTSANQEDPFFHLGRVAETKDGIIVRGAKMLGTMAPLTEELLVTPFGGVPPGDDAYALVFAIPSNTPGVKFVCREAFNNGDRTLFDHPLSSRFEEMDCIAIFDDVLVPWDRIIVDGSPGSGAVVNGAPFDPRNGVPVQTTARLLASLELLCGVATRLADAIGITGFLHIQEKLGQMLLQLEQVRVAFHASDLLATEGPEGYWLSYGDGMTVANMLAGSIHAQFVDILHTLAGGGFFYAPMEADFQNRDLRPFLDKYVRGRPGIVAEERVKLFKLAWDLSGDAFGQRLRQYVKFYSGDPVRNIAGFYLGYDKAPLTQVVDRVLAGADAKVDASTPGSIAVARDQSDGLTLSYPAASHPMAPRVATTGTG